MRSMSLSMWRLPVSFMAPRNNTQFALLFSFVFVRLPLCNNDICDIYLYTLCYYIYYLLGACMRCTRLCPLKLGCDRSGIRGNVDYRTKPRQNWIKKPNLLTFTLILSILILILSHLLLFYSNDSYLFYSETRWISHLGILQLQTP